MDDFLIAYRSMLQEIRDFRSLRDPTEAEKAMIDLLEVIECGGTLGLDAHVVIEELVNEYKKWKFGIDGRFERLSRHGESGPLPTWPFLNPLPDVSSASAEGRVETVVPAPELEAVAKGPPRRDKAAVAESPARGTQKG